MQKPQWFRKVEENLPNDLTVAVEKFESYSKDLSGHIGYAVSDFFTDRNMESKDMETLKKHRKIYSRIALASLAGGLTTFVTPAGVLFLPLFIYCQRKGVIYDEHMRKRSGVYPLEFER